MPIGPNDFVHLHVHSEYSLLDGANRIGPMLEHTSRLGMKSLALTDHGVLFGALEFIREAKEHGIQPIIGCEVYLTPAGRTVRQPGEQRKTHHQLLLAENYRGYQNLCRLSSIGFIEGFYYKPRIDFETLAAHREGLIATSSCLAGLIPQALLRNQTEQAEEYLQWFLEVFGRERFFIELQDHGLREQQTVNGALLEMARRFDLKLIASNDCHYMTREDAQMHDTLLCIQTGSRVSERDRLRFETEEFYVKSAGEMEALFSDHPTCLTNTRLVAEMCSLQMPEKEYHLPRFECPNGQTEAEHLREKVWEGARKRYGEPLRQEVRDRIEYELKTIESMGFPAYFLIVADVIAYARGQGIPVGPGRGSAAGSVVAYCTRITELDPLEYGLLFERFLNPDRISMPDIDIDFCFERRGEVIEYVRHKYGEDCVAQICTFGTMKAKAAVRDVGRVLDLPLNVVDRVAKAIPNELKMTLPKALEQSEELRRMVQSDPQIKQLCDMANKIEGMVRHASTHAAGVVISDKPLVEYCPLYKAPSEDRAATQFNMIEIEEDIGLLKMDFLGIKNLTIIDRVIKWLRERENVEIDWDSPEMARKDDPETYRMLQRGQTLGVFQLESQGMTALVKRLKPTDFADLIALLALYRPGPLQAGMHDMYVRRKHGEEKIAYDHPILEPILKESYGVILYQEQVMRISTEMCGFTGGEADVLRKAMGKKKADVMAEMKVKFVEGAQKKSNVDERLAERIWNNIITFAGYGFNKSHTAAYAVITYQTAYLRANYPTYFMAALLTNELNGTTDGIGKYISNCREIHLEVLPVDINRSIDLFNPDGKRIWYALAAVKGVGGAFAKAIVREREKDGPFESLQDFCMRIPHEEMNSRMAEALVRVGAFDSLHPNRSSLLAALPQMLELATEVQRQKGTGQEDLFDAGDGEPAESLVETVTIPNVPPWSLRERAENEKEFLGFYLSDHPLNEYRVELESFSEATSTDIAELAEEYLETGKKESLWVTSVGRIQSIMMRTDKNGNPWAILTMEDLHGRFDCKAFAKTFGTYQDDLQPDRVIQVTGRLSLWNGRLSFDIQSVRRVEDLRSAAKGVELEWRADRLHDLGERALFDLKETCRRFGGNRPLRICVRQADSVAEFPVNGECRVQLSADCLQALQKLPGSPAVRLIPGQTERRGRARNGLRERA